MPKKRAHDLRLLTVEQQQELISRFQTRKNVRDANRQLAKLVLSWVLDRSLNNQEFMEQFEAAGHESQYHVDPSVTTRSRVMSQAAELPNILKRLDDTPLDYMGALELSFVHQRVVMMIEVLEDIPRGTMIQAIALYRVIGDRIRQKVFTETGHYPEQFPFPYGRITGNEEPSQFKLTDHQPQLF